MVILSRSLGHSPLSCHFCNRLRCYLAMLLISLGLCPDVRQLINRVRLHQNDAMCLVINNVPF